MGLQLPGELVSLLGMIGYDWPASDEEKLFGMGQTWLAFAGDIESSSAELGDAARQTTEGSTGEAIEAFRRWWSGDDNAFGALTRSSTGATILGAALIVCATVVLALKLQMIVQLVLLAIQILQAIATAAVTFGASLLEIPIFKLITETVIGLLVDQAISALLGG